MSPLMWTLVAVGGVVALGVLLLVFAAAAPVRVPTLGDPITKEARDRGIVGGLVGGLLG